MNPDFSFPIRVYVEDTDAGGIVYYVNYLKFMERARTEFMRSLGFEQKLGVERGLGSESEFQFVVHSAEMKFLKPARMNMELNSILAIKKLAKTYIVFDQAIIGKHPISQEGPIYCTAEIKIACIDNAGFKPRAMPDIVAEGLKAVFAPALVENDVLLS